MAVAILWALATLCSLFVPGATEEIILNVNVKRPIAVVGERFLSVTLDPVVFFNSNLLRDEERSTNMARALAPAYVRIAGPRSNSYIFERELYRQKPQLDPDYTFTETDWIQIHDWAERSGLDVIACIAPHQLENVLGNARSTSWDPRNALDLISFSDHMGFNTSWQLGYECQARCEPSGGELGRDVQRLRSVLDAFPRYAERGLVVGPDVLAYGTRLQQQYLHDYFAAAAGALSAVTWHPDFAGVSLEIDGVSMHYDNLAFDREIFYRLAGRHIAKKPLWLAESRPEESKERFLGALVWTRRLGNSARLGAQVLMRQPFNSNLFEATPDYWVSMLHKTLVGREVLDTKIATGNRTHVYFYAHCARPSARYDKGSLTVFGINLTPSKITASLKGLKLKVVHKYILLPGYDTHNRLFAESVSLNNEPLSLVSGKELPIIQPAISSAEKGVKLKLPSGGIGFWVLPGLRIKSCMGHEYDLKDKNILKNLNKRIEEIEGDDEVELVDYSNPEQGKYSYSEERKTKVEQETSQKVTPLRRSVRRRDREWDEQEEQKTQKLDYRTKYDSDRFDKMMENDRNLHYNKDINSYKYLEHSNENVESSLEDESVGRDLNMDSIDFILAKLQKYRRRLAEIEKQRRSYEQTIDVINEPIKTDQNAQNASDNKDIDTKKVLEALTLLAQVENTIKDLEKESTTEAKMSTSTVLPLVFTNLTDVAVTIQKDAKAMEHSDSLLDKINNTEKNERTNVSATLDEHLTVLHKLLSEGKQKRENQPTLRPKRDLTTFGDDMFGFLQNKAISKRSKSEDIKGRLLERINERKRRLRQRQGLRREKLETKKDSHNKDDRGLLIKLPSSDLFLPITVRTIEKKNSDPVYTSRKEQKQLKNRTSMQLNSSKGSSTIDGDVGKQSNEYISNEKANDSNGNIKSTGYYKKSNVEEPWRADLLQKYPATGRYDEEDGGTINYKVVTEKQSPVSNNRKLKEKPVLDHPSYYNIDPYSSEDISDFKQQPYYNPLIASYYPSTNQYYGRQNTYTNPHAYYFDPRIQSLATYRRIKRHINDIEDVLHREMITQDDNNLKDCQCRVIRSSREYRNCILQHLKYLDKTLSARVSKRKQYANAYKYGARFKREITKPDTAPENEEQASVDSQIQPSTSEEQQEKLKDITENEKNVDKPNETKEIKEVSMVNMKQKLNPENYSETQLTNRLPRKIETLPKFILSDGKISLEIKKNSKINKENSRFIKDNNATNSSLVIDKVEASFEHNGKVRSKNESSSQTTNINSSNLTFSSRKEINSPKTDNQSLNFINNYTNSESVNDKNQEPYKNSNDNIKTNFKQNIKEPSTRLKRNQTSLPLISKMLLASKGNINKKSQSTDLKTTKTIMSQNIGLHDKLKNTTIKNAEDLPKSRQSTLITKTEALAALKKENESKRAKRIIEASLKMIEKENVKFLESQRKRREQLERLKLKLRVKREKMLQQYRDELLEAINESSDNKQRNIHRRHSLGEYSTLNDELKEDDVVISPEELSLVMHSRPVRFTEEELMKSLENRRFLPLLQVTPYHEFKRSPYSFLNKYGTRNIDSSGDMNDFITEGQALIVPEPQYGHAESQLLAEMYPEITYNEEDNPFQTKHSKESEISNPFYDYDQENIEHLHSLDSGIDKENMNQYKNENMYSNTYQEGLQEYQQKQEPQELNNSDFPVHPSFQEDQLESVEKSSVKAKRSILKFVEKDPSIYEEGEPDHNIQDLLMTPLSSLSSRNYHYDANAQATKRSRRSTRMNNRDNIEGPLAFSLPLKESEMSRKRSRNNASPESLIRRKRTSQDLPNKREIFFHDQSVTNKNIKKVYKTDLYNKYNKFPKSSKCRKHIQYSLRPPAYAANERKNVILNTLEDNLLKNEKIMLKRPRRSFEENDYRRIKANGIENWDDLEMDEIWNNIIEIKKDKELLREYDRQKSKIMQKFRENQRKRFLKTTAGSSNKERNLTAEHNDETTTESDVESILVDTIPKLQTVITGGLEKAQNLTGSLENFIENFDEQYDEITENLKDSSKISENSEANDGRISHDIFKTMVGSVKKFFGFISGIAKIFHGH